MLRPTFTSVATAGVSGVIAAASLQAAALPSISDRFVLGAAVFGGTYLAAKFAKFAGAAVGGAVGGLFGGGVSAGVAAALSPQDKGANAVLGGAAGGMASAFIFGAVGAFMGFWTGAFVGHDWTKNALIGAIAPESTKVQRVENIPQPPLVAPTVY